VLLTGITAAKWGDTPPQRRAEVLQDPTQTILGGALALSQLAVCVLGVLIITSEYSTGVIRASLLAVPRRVPMLAAKAVVFSALIFVIGEVVSFVAFVIGAALLHAHAPVSLSDPGVLRSVIGGGLYLTVVGLFSLAIGTIVRITAASITGVIAFILVLAPLAQLIPGRAGEYVHSYLPTEAGQMITYPHGSTSNLLGPWQGFGVFCAWTAVLLVVGAVLLERRDA
jgi:ABC-type transport system involved in multi-copper enzyme maturation permease subunit